ncbi:MAG: hypothetical protein K8R90_09910 [Candidatus Cloacimonetes bacterium]|nr:hypothetical protein [Candidatus Cloacimonadota bacterium]
MLSIEIGGLFAVACGISTYLIAHHHGGEQAEWHSSKWFWLGLFGNLPALVAYIGHLLLQQRQASSALSPQTEDTPDKTGGADLPDDVDEKRGDETAPQETQ